MRSGHLLAELTRDEVQLQAPESTVILPIAAVEQHGPHLPIITDTCIVESLSDRVANSVSVPVIIAPTVCYGASQHHFPFPGVMSLSSSSFMGVLRDLLDSLARSGARRVYLLNAHGGNDEIIRLIAREESHLLGMAIGAASYWSLAWDEMLSADALEKVGPLPGHAGSFETALMMALRPDLVREDRLLSPSPYPPPSIWPVGSRGSVVVPRGTQLGTGTSDDGRNATSEWGNCLLDMIVRAVSEAIESFHRSSGTAAGLTSR